MGKKNALPFTFVRVDPASPDNLESEKRWKEITERAAKNEAEEKIRAEEYFRMNPDAHENNQGSSGLAFQGRDYTSVDNSLQTVSAADAEMREIFWALWGWIALRKVIIIGGPPSIGKSTLAWAIAARFSQGGDHPSWPGPASPGWANVLVISTEDDFNDSIAPKLAAACANLDNVRTINGVDRFSPTRPFRFWDDEDVKSLIAYADREKNVHLIIVDPVYAIVKGDANNNSKMRDALERLNSLAERLNCAIIGIAHTTKVTKGKPAINRLAGPRSLVEYPRGMNILTPSRPQMRGTSSMSPNSCLVQVESWQGSVPELKAA